MMVLRVSRGSLLGCRRAGAGLEYCVFAGMLGLTLVIMFQLFGDTLSGVMAAALGKVTAATSTHGAGLK